MMERILTQEEKIRRAEEIYYRRKNINGMPSGQYATLNVGEKKDYKLFRKMILQIIACLAIYITFYVIQNSNYIFSEQVINKTKEILSYDINFEEITNTVLPYINKLKNSDVLMQIENRDDMEEQKIEESAVLPNIDISYVLANSVNLAIDDDPLYTEEASSINQMQEDANYIKENHSFIQPVKGTVSSRFGARNPTTPTVPKYHTGIDIAANKGTDIVAAMGGKVTQVSSAGDYGKHLRIESGEVTTLYAHCNKIYVKEGDEIKQGQKIAEVGATGNVTGAHLHFEIRRNNEFVDPEYVLDFN